LYENKPRKAIIVCASEKTKQIVAKKKKTKDQRPRNRKAKKKTKENTGIVLSPSFVWWVVENVSGKRRNLGVVWLNSFQ
jgi:hypothetical protein